MQEKPGEVLREVSRSLGAELQAALLGSGLRCGLAGLGVLGVGSKFTFYSWCGWI